MFSVVVPAFNKEDFIERTIDSVLSQRYSDFELIVVDDGSTDRTAALVADYQDDRVRLIRQNNKGEGAARNAGIACAGRPWIAFLDADDYWFDDHLSELASIVSRFPNVGLIATSYMTGSEWHAAPPDPAPSMIEKIDYFKEAGRNIGVIWSSTAAIRRDIASQVGGFGGARRGADQEYWVKAALRTQVGRSRRITAYYYRHAGGVMATDHRRREVAPERIEDMWPSVAVIRSVETDAAYRGIRAGLVAYERHATFLSMIGYIARREFSVARRLAGRLPGHRLDRAAVVAALLHLPDIALRFLLYLRSSVARRSE